MPYTWTDNNLDDVLIKSIHYKEIRDRIEIERERRGLSTTWNYAADPNLNKGGATQNESINEMYENIYNVDNNIDCNTHNSTHLNDHNSNFNTTDESNERIDHDSNINTDHFSSEKSNADNSVLNSAKGDYYQRNDSSDNATHLSMDNDTHDNEEDSLFYSDDDNNYDNNHYNNYYHPHLTSKDGNDDSSRNSGRMYALNSYYHGGLCDSEAFARYGTEYNNYYDDVYNAWYGGDHHEYYQIATGCSLHNASFDSTEYHDFDDAVLTSVHSYDNSDVKDGHDHSIYIAYGS